MLNVGDYFIKKYTDGGMIVGKIVSIENEREKDYKVDIFYSTSEYAPKSTNWRVGEIFMCESFKKTIEEEVWLYLI